MLALTLGLVVPSARAAQDELGVAYWESTDDRDAYAVDLGTPSSPPSSRA
ncbi:hypothetical protein ACIBHX_28675 [Nonomuraea sp. NPDC050536]